jgi:hypothetical protein
MMVNVPTVTMLLIGPTSTLITADLLIVNRATHHQTVKIIMLANVPIVTTLITGPRSALITWVLIIVQRAMSLRAATGPDSALTATPLTIGPMSPLIIILTLTASLAINVLTDT